MHIKVPSTEKLDVDCPSTEQNIHTEKSASPTDHVSHHPANGAITPADNQPGDSLVSSDTSGDNADGTNVSHVQNSEMISSQDGDGETTETGQASPTLVNNRSGAHLSLAALQDPQTFNLGDATPPSKRKITKSSFLDGRSGLSDGVEAADPLSQLDALWTVKPKS